MLLRWTIFWVSLEVMVRDFRFAEVAGMEGGVHVVGAGVEDRE
jgi:hypothetical protein